MSAGELFTEEQAAALLTRLTYKPGWHLELIPGPEGPRLRITAVVTDARNRHRRLVPQPSYGLGPEWNVTADPLPSAGATVAITAMVDVREALYGLEARVAEELLLQDVHHAILQLEAHEVREWLRLDGRMVDSPHRREPEPGEAHRGILGLLGVFT